ncbi:hypothetical protein GCM10023195_86460 [Actinoallomurus liliacearum]|uniref:Uncharacterized protein n=1 Tax=Actinoallomurus liliacearum TaxID=1080073 RepID=A0ABP8TXV7_9ACTN
MAGKPENGDVVVSGYFDSTLTGVRKPEVPKGEFSRPVRISARETMSKFEGSSRCRKPKHTIGSRRIFLMDDQITEGILRTNDLPPATGTSVWKCVLIPDRLGAGWGECPADAGQVHDPYDTVLYDAVEVD